MMMPIANAIDWPFPGGGQHRGGLVDLRRVPNCSAMIRNAFSTITTAPSTIMPMPIASPRATSGWRTSPACPMPMNAPMSIASGSVTITTSRAQLAQEQEQDHRDQQDRLHQARTAVPTALLTRIGALVDGLEHHGLRQRIAHHIELALTASTTSFAFSPMRARPAQHDLPAVAGHRTEPARALYDRRHVAQVHRHAVLGLEHDRADIFGRLQQAQAAHQELFAARPSRCHRPGRCWRERVDDIAKPSPGGMRPLRIDLHLVLAFAAAPGTDIVDARAVRRISRTVHSCQVRRSMSLT